MVVFNILYLLVFINGQPYQVSQPRPTTHTGHTMTPSPAQPAVLPPRERKIIKITDDKGNDYTNEIMAGKPKPKEPTPVVASSTVTEAPPQQMVRPTLMNKFHY